MKNKIILFGGGPSVKEPIADGLFSLIKGCAKIASINYFYLSMPYLPDYQIFSDQHFWNEEERKVKVHPNRQVISRNKMSKLQSQGVQLIYRYMGRTRTIPDAETYNANKVFGVPNSLYYGINCLAGMFALSWAVRNFKEIFLLGYDLTDLNGATHSYEGQIKTSSYGVGNKELLITYQKNLDDWKKYLDIKGVKIYNVSKISRINCFEKINYSKMYKLLEK